MPFPSAEKSADDLMDFPLYLMCYFSLTAFKILSLTLIFVILTTMCLSMNLFGSILFGTLCFRDQDVYFLSQVREVFSSYLIMATNSSNLAWKISWTEEPGRLQSMGLQRIRHD